MKKLFFTLSTGLFALTTLMGSTAFASKKPKGGSALPINNGVIFLTIAAVAIGVFVLIKARSAKKLAHK